MSKILRWFFLLLFLAACGGPQEDYYLPATEVLVEGNTSFCVSKIELTVVRINEDTVMIKALCKQRTTNDGSNSWEVTSETEFIAPKTDKLMALVNQEHYSWGVITNDENELLQIFEGGGSNGLVHIHWPPPETE